MTIHSYCWILAHSFPEDGAAPKLIIGDHVGIGMNATISAAKKIVIERHVLMARNVYISDHGHGYTDINVPISEQNISKVAEVRIGAGTWLGQNSVILPGVAIGRHCIIGANAVVTKGVPSYSVVAGAPAKIIKRYDFKHGRWTRAR